MKSLQLIRWPLQPLHFSLCISRKRHKITILTFCRMWLEFASSSINHYTNINSFTNMCVHIFVFTYSCTEVEGLRWRGSARNEQGCCVRSAASLQWRRVRGASFWDRHSSRSSRTLSTRVVQQPRRRTRGEQRAALIHRLRHFLLYRHSNLRCSYVKSPVPTSAAGSYRLWLYISWMYAFN